MPVHWTENPEVKFRLLVNPHINLVVIRVVEGVGLQNRKNESFLVGSNPTGESNQFNYGGM